MRFRIYIYRRARIVVSLHKTKQQKTFCYTRYHVFSNKLLHTPVYILPDIVGAIKLLCVPAEAWRIC